MRRFSRVVRLPSRSLAEAHVRIQRPNARPRRELCLWRLSVRNRMRGTALTTPGNIKLWIEIKYSFARQIDNAQIGIPGTLHATFRRTREVAIQSWRGVQ